MAQVIIDEIRCKGCGLCTIACPQKLIKLSEKINTHGYTPAILTSQEKCTGCALCAEMCPDLAIMVYREAKSK